MRKLIVSVFVTLDGVMQGPGGPDEDRDGGFEQGGWSVNYWDDAMGEAITDIITAPCDLLLGRRTYDIFAAHWPRVSDDPVADKLNAAVKHVATSSPGSLSWHNSKPLTGDVAAAVAALKRQGGPDLLVQGSCQLIQTLLEHGLIDEIRLWVFPVVVGSGKRLFGSGTVPAAFALRETMTSTTGVTIGRYEQAGALQTGSFALEDAAA